MANEVTNATAGKNIYLYAGADGRLCGWEQWLEQVKVAGLLNESVANIKKKFEKGEYTVQPVAEVVERPSSSVLRIKLLV